MIHWEAFTLGLLLLPYPQPAAAVLTVAPSWRHRKTPHVIMLSLTHKRSSVEI
jgi:hypothetical protein